MPISTGLTDTRGRRLKYSPLTGQTREIAPRSGRTNPSTGVTIYDSYTPDRGAYDSYPTATRPLTAEQQNAKNERDLQNDIISTYGNELYNKYQSGPQGFSMQYGQPDHIANMQNSFQSIPDNRAAFLSKYPKAAQYESVLQQGERKAFSDLQNLTYVKGGVLDDLKKFGTFAAQVASWVAPFVLPLPPGVSISSTSQVSSCQERSGKGEMESL